LDRNPPSSLVLGIDTGGTYTDGVLLEYPSRRVLASYKSLTTKRDFAIGIESVIDGINVDDPASIRMVSVSTTLATNAIAEGKGKRVALILIGYDPDLITTFKMEDRFATPYYHFFRGGHDLYGREQEELDLPAILARVTEIKGNIDAIAVSSYFSPLNPEHENRVLRAVSSICSLPVVLGHQLSTKLGSVERATTAALNASLLAVLQDFVVAVRRAMERRQIDAPLMMVRGDGTLMSDEFAAHTPVETIHSGPAASAIGGHFLTQVDSALVIDVGGTTTDFAFVDGGQVSVTEEGATVGDFKTSVRAANLLSIALGGDSHITIDHEQRIVVGPERVTPLAYLAWVYPRVRRQLQALAQRAASPVPPDWLEYWFLLREPQRDQQNSPRERALIDFLREAPQPLPEILRHLKLLHAGQVGAQHLLRQEVIGKSCITPTDLMHIEGRYDAWDAEASLLAWNAFCKFHFRDPDEVRGQAWAQMSEMILHAIVTYLTGRRLELSDRQRSLSGSDGDMGRWFFYNSLCPAHPYLDTRIRLRQPIIGIGAPAAIFLPDVAKALQTDLILPEYHEVANAVGAIAGSVMVEEELLVYPQYSRSGLEVFGYYLQASDERYEFERLGAALARARELGRERAFGAAIRSGADNPQVTVEEFDDGLDTYRIRAKAIGNPRLAS
jgi:N-methylhydantoinase A/oxoprolinase/acetone carboxylase beta subunit